MPKENEGKNSENTTEKKGVITLLEERFISHEEPELIRLLYNYITTHENMGIDAAKALVKIASVDTPDKKMQASAVTFIEILFEDKLNNREFQDSQYYIDKILKGEGKNTTDEISR